jgi:hypothetical protein
MAKAITPVANSITTISMAVQKERDAIHAAYKRASKSKKTAKAFLVSAGILNKKGELAESYR